MVSKPFFFIFTSSKTTFLFQMKPMRKLQDIKHASEAAGMEVCLWDLWSPTYLSLPPAPLPAPRKPRILETQGTHSVSKRGHLAKITWRWNSSGCSLQWTPWCLSIYMEWVRNRVDYYFLYNFYYERCHTYSKRERIPNIPMTQHQQLSGGQWCFTSALPIPTTLRLFCSQSPFYDHLVKNISI